MTYQELLTLLVLTTSTRLAELGIRDTDCVRIMRRAATAELEKLEGGREELEPRLEEILELAAEIDFTDPEKLQRHLDAMKGLIRSLLIDWEQGRIVRDEITRCKAEKDGARCVLHPGHELEPDSDGYHRVGSLKWPKLVEVGDPRD